MYGGDCARSRDVDSLESKTRDLEYDMDRKCDDLQHLINRLETRIDELLERIRALENTSD